MDAIVERPWMDSQRFIALLLDLYLTLRCSVGSYPYITQCATQLLLSDLKCRALLEDVSGVQRE